MTVANLPGPQRIAVIALIASGALAMSTGLEWATVRLGGVELAEFSPRGWDEIGGKAMLIVAAIGVAVSALTLLGQRNPRLTAWLLGAGVAGFVVAVLNFATVASRAQRVEVLFDTHDVSARAGLGLWVAAAGSAGLVVAGFFARRNSG